MSRQFDENMEDKFEYQGELKSLIFPTSFSELVEQSASLFNQITKKVDAVKLSPDIRSIVLAYLQ